MTTRRDNPDSALWRLAVEAFNHVLIDYVTKLINGGPDSTISKPVRTRIWKEIADVYEIFLIGYCGRALPSNSISAVVLEADESLEMSILNILGDTILKLPVDTPLDVSSSPIVLLVIICTSWSCYEHEHPMYYWYSGGVLKAIEGWLMCALDLYVATC